MPESIEGTEDETPPIGHDGGPLGCCLCKTPRPPLDQVFYWGFSCSMCARTFCSKCALKTGLTGYASSFACEPCCKAREKRRRGR